MTQESECAGRVRPGELVEQRIGQGGACACSRDRLRLAHAVRDGLEGRRRKLIVALNAHASAALAESGESTLRADEALGSIRRDRHLADEEADRADEITEGTNLIEDALGHHDRELALERQRQLDEVE